MVSATAKDPVWAQARNNYLAAQDRYVANIRATNADESGLVASSPMRQEADQQFRTATQAWRQAETEYRQRRHATRAQEHAARKEAERGRFGSTPGVPASPAAAAPQGAPAIAGQAPSTPGGVEPHPRPERRVPAREPAEVVDRDRPERQPRATARYTSSGQRLAGSLLN